MPDLVGVRAVRCARSRFHRWHRTGTAHFGGVCGKDGEIHARRPRSPRGKGRPSRILEGVKTCGVGAFSYSLKTQGRIQEGTAKRLSARRSLDRTDADKIACRRSAFLLCARVRVFLMVSGVPAASVSALAVSAWHWHGSRGLRSRRFLDLRCGVGGLGGGFARAGRRFGHGGPFRPRPACEPSPSDALPHRAGSLRTARSGRRTRGYVFFCTHCWDSPVALVDVCRTATDKPSRTRAASRLACWDVTVVPSKSRSELTTVQRLGQCDAGIAPTLRWNPRLSAVAQQAGSQPRHHHHQPLPVQFASEGEQALGLLAAHRKRQITALGEQPRKNVDEPAACG